MGETLWYVLALVLLFGSFVLFAVPFVHLAGGDTWGSVAAASFAWILAGAVMGVGMFHIAPRFGIKPPTVIYTPIDCGQQLHFNPEKFSATDEPFDSYRIPRLDGCPHD